MLGAEVSFHEGPKCLFQKKRPTCPIGAELVGAELVEAELVGAEVVGAEVSNPHPPPRPSSPGGHPS